MECFQKKKKKKKENMIHGLYLRIDFSFLPLYDLFRRPSVRLVELRGIFRLEQEADGESYERKVQSGGRIG